MKHIYQYGFLGEGRFVFLSLERGWEKSPDLKNCIRGELAGLARSIELGAGVEEMKKKNKFVERVDFLEKLRTSRDRDNRETAQYILGGGYYRRGHAVTAQDRRLYEVLSDQEVCPFPGLKPKKRAVEIPVPRPLEVVSELPGYVLELIGKDYEEMQVKLPWKSGIRQRIVINLLGSNDSKEIRMGRNIMNVGRRANVGYNYRGRVHQNKELYSFLSGKTESGLRAIIHEATMPDALLRPNPAPNPRTTGERAEVSRQAVRVSPESGLEGPFQNVVGRTLLVAKGKWNKAASLISRTTGDRSYLDRLKVRLSQLKDESVKKGLSEKDFDVLCTEERVRLTREMYQLMSANEFNLRRKKYNGRRISLALGWKNEAVKAKKNPAFLSAKLLRPLSVTEKKTKRTLKSYAEVITFSARKEGVDRDLMCKIISQESGGDPFAVSPTYCFGIAQFYSGNYNGSFGFPPINPFNPAEALPRMANLLKRLKRAYRGDVWFMLMAYNQGPRVANEARRGLNTRAIREGQNYARAVLRQKEFFVPK